MSKNIPHILSDPAKDDKIFFWHQGLIRLRLKNNLLVHGSGPADTIEYSGGNESGPADTIEYSATVWLWSG